MKLKSKLPVHGLVLVFILGMMSDLHACTVCFGDKNDHIVQSISLAILLLLGIICSVLAALTIGAVVLVKREQKFSQEAIGE